MPRADFLVYFQAEEDRNTAWAPKVAVVFGLTLACLVVLLLPMDVANRSTNGGLDMTLAYEASMIGLCPVARAAQLVPRKLCLVSRDPQLATRDP